ncbi:DUF4249 family protein [candidate division KSB1 bacterium]|nr:DUF4249 family protein [candidate division KSB1 bacterium]
MQKTLQRGVLAACLAVLACEAESPLLPESEMLVVRGYLYSGEPVKDIQLTTTYAISSDDTSGQPINDAQVTLEKAGKIYPLALTPGDSGYYHYAGYDLTVEAADRFTITVARHGQVASATTEIPPAPNNVQISATEFVVSSMATPFDTSAIIVSWDNPDESFYFVTVENIEAVRTPINDLGNAFPRGAAFVRSRPMRENRYAIRRFALSYLGQHRVRVYKVNQEYADLYAFGQQDSRNLNEPLTNVKNGLGVFAGFSSAEVRFSVRKE